MDNVQSKRYLLLKPEAIEDFPFGSDVAVFKVKGKMFATLSQASSTNKGLGKVAGYWCMNLKCEPQQADALRSIFPSVIPGYHMNKRHWNTIILDGTIPQGEIQRMIDHSYTLVVKTLKKSVRELLEMHYSKEELYK